MAETMAPSVRPIRIVRRPITGMLLPIPIVCFIGALITDLTYSSSGGNLLWLNFSTWLIPAGLVFGAIAGITLLIDAIRGSASWTAFLLLLAAWLVELINSMVHARDGWTAVVSLGIVLSIIGVVLALLSGWSWQSSRYRTRGHAA
jgi:uncharacterized membrane protein